MNIVMRIMQLLVKRVCNFYEFRGEYNNYTPLESSYVPYVDPKTRKLIKKLLKLRSESLMVTAIGQCQKSFKKNMNIRCLKES